MEYTNIINNISSCLSVQIQKGRLVTKEPGWKITKSFGAYSLWVITEGELELKINNKHYTLSKGDVALFRPGNRHSASSPSGCKLLFVYFTLKMGAERDLLEAANISGMLSKAFIGKESLVFCDTFLELYSIAQRIPLKLYVSFIDFLYTLITFIESDDFVHFYNRANPLSESSMHNALMYIEEHYSENITAKEIAHKMHLSESSFVTKFKNIVGASPGAYITEFRIKKSVELLLSTTMKQDEIAKSVGYTNQYTFSKAFKKHFGESPSKFRHNPDNIEMLP